MLPGCAIGGITLALLSHFVPSASSIGVTTKTFAFTSLLTIPVFTPTWVYAISIFASFATAALLIIFLDYRTQEQLADQLKDIKSRSTSTTPDFSNTKSNENIACETIIVSPVDGQAISLEECGDEVFASKALGEGVAIIPSDALANGDYIDVLSPADCEIKTIAETAHAITLSTKSGVDILIHIGIDTVKLNGEGFKTLVKENTFVNKNAPIVQVNFGQIKDKGYKIPIIMTIVNSDQMKNIDLKSIGNSIKAKEDIITIR